VNARLACLLLAAPLGVLLGCDLPKGPAQARLWTIDDYVALYQGRGDVEEVPPLPASIPPDKLLIDEGNGRYRLVLSPTMERGYNAAYVTTDLWQGFEQIWVQPMFILVKGWTDAGPQRFKDDDPRARRIFSVGPKSRFYSPYWETVFVKVPEDVPESRYRSATDILNDRTLETRASEGRTASLLLPDVMIDPADPERLANPRLPPKDQRGPTVVRGTGYLDGGTIDYLDFGVSGFRWNKAREVEEVPLYDLTFRDDSGQLRSFGGTKLGDAGPLDSGRLPMSLPGNHPKYGAYWRLYNVELPDSARVFAPKQFAAYRARLLAAGVRVNAEADAINNEEVASVDDVEPYVGQVVLDSACLVTLPALKDCKSSLSSPERLELLVPPSAIHKTDVTVTCPFVSYDDSPVPNP
jgi:hypothetical protein